MVLSMEMVPNTVGVKITGPVDTKSNLAQSLREQSAWHHRMPRLCTECMQPQKGVRISMWRTGVYAPDGPEMIWENEP